MSARKLYNAGFRNLVSVTPPDAELAPTTGLKLESRGKVPGKQRLDSRWVGYPFTKDDPPTERDIEKWEQWGSNIGLRGDFFPGLDVDVDHSQLARFVVQEAHKRLGSAPIRTSRDPRRLLVYRTEEPFPKMVATITFQGAEHKVELLGKGRQYLVHGDHPSGTKYGWVNRPLWESSPDDLTVITQEQIRDFFSHLADRLRGRAQVEIQGAKEATPPPPQESLEAPDLESLRELVSMIPNKYPDRESYLQVGYAIKAAGGEEVFDVWEDWCSRWEQGDNEPETVKRDWDSMKPPYRVGWPYLQDLASQFTDYTPAEDEFEADPGKDFDTPLPGVGAGMTDQDVIELTDTWVVERVARRLKDKVRYLPETGHFHVWSKGLT